MQTAPISHKKRDYTPCVPSVPHAVPKMRKGRPRLRGNDVSEKRFFRRPFPV